MRFIRLVLSASLVAILCPPFSACSNAKNGDLFHTHSAWCLNRGQFCTSAHSSVYFKRAKFHDINNVSQSATYWDIRGGLSGHYGFTDHLELGIRQIVYQDNHKASPGYNLPDDLFLSGKLGSLGPRRSNFRFGGMLNVRLPLAKHHNIVLEPYSAGRIELGAKALLSFLSNPSNPNQGYALHFNIGLLDHNDVGKTLTDVPQDTITAHTSSRQLLISFGSCVHLSPFQFGLEISGNGLVRQPPATAYSRETYLYATPSVSFKAKRWLTVTAGVDVLLKRSDDETDYSSLLPRAGYDFRNFPPWRLHVCCRALLPSGEKPEETPVVPQRVIAETAPVSEPTIDQLARERRQTESAEEELERIRQERERVARILAKLRQMISSTKQEQSEKEKPKAGEKP